ncbi:histidine kinase [Streptomyces sp. NPDC020875]|uniref:sensor histidine kinase n=1 Tax=Streptomyces sp. NPDC020875 TaxID=3154898 RepID=UPI00340EF12A
MSMKLWTGRIRRGWEWLEPDPRRRRAPGTELTIALVTGCLSTLLGMLFDEGRTVWLVLLGVGVAVLTLLRRRYPATVFLVTAAVSGWLAGMALALPLMAWSAGRRIEQSGRTLAAFIGAYLLIHVIGLLDYGPGLTLTPLMVGLGALLYLALVVVPGLGGRYVAQRQTLLDTLRERNAQLQWESRMVAGQARLRERQRIAQDMHDSLGHQLALIAVHTGALEVDSELTERQRDAVGVLRQASVGAMHELREVVGILRDGETIGLEPVDESGRAARGTAGVADLVAAARGAGKEVALRQSGERRPLAAAADHAAYRIVQEALTNAYKHAPGASIAVELRYEPDSLVVEIVNGPALPGGPVGEVVSGGQGLTGLRERARLVGGIVHAGAVGGGGFRVAGVLPYGAGEKAPFVAPDEDFPTQPGFGPPGHGVPAMNWNSVAGQEPVMSGGYGPTAGGRRGGMLGGIGLGCGISVLVVMALVALVVVGGFLLFNSAEENLVSNKEYDSIALGAPEDEVRSKMPSSDSFWATGISDAEGHPRKPEGSECLVVVSEESGSDLDREPVFRFCFRDGKLIEKKSYEVKVDF